MKNNNEEIRNVINETLKNFNYLSDANTVVGTPIFTENNVTIIPVTKMTVGFLSGGGEYGEIKLFQKSNAYPLSSGSGGLVTVKPCGFIIESKGKVKYLSCPQDRFEKISEEFFKVLEGVDEKN
ncbi:MAG: hypothetical protein J5762_05810 [Clostridia bacterium]|nr:hypothetical protein [Clostridia bacterium]